MSAGAPAIGLLLTLSAVVGLFGRSYLPLTPAFARDLLHTDAQGLGFLVCGAGARRAGRGRAARRRAG